MRMFITSKNKYLSNDMKIFGTCSIPLILVNDEIYLISCDFIKQAKHNIMVFYCVNTGPLFYGMCFKV